jgi:phospholipid/cholesterol/gamma-HCH transport system permease protein
MAQAENATVEISALADGPRVSLRGDWNWRRPVPAFAALESRLAAMPGRVRVEASALGAHDSTLVAFLLALGEWADKAERPIEWEDLPADTRRLLDLARRVPERADAGRADARRAGLLETVGRETEEALRGAYAVCAFTGAYVEAFGRLLLGRAHFRWRDFWLVTQRVGADALPIVALISFLVGVIISFLGAVTLRQFAAEFAVAYLVGYGMLREMGAIMTGIIMAGRTGAAFAAELGSMKVNEELDALRTFGISPVEHLVLPRILAMLVMMPFLTAYANVIGIFGGWLVADLLMGLPGGVFFDDLNYVVGPWDLFLGLFKGTVFGYLVATAGCLRGMQCGAGASAVGVATTRAVVTGITLIIMATAVIDWVAATLGI